VQVACALARMVTLNNPYWISNLEADNNSGAMKNLPLQSRAALRLPPWLYSKRLSTPRDAAEKPLPHLPASKTEGK
jgi:hypothetical protein